jgi:hypothetical protein
LLAALLSRTASLIAGTTLRDLQQVALHVDKIRTKYAEVALLEAISEQCILHPTEFPVNLLQILRRQQRVGVGGGVLRKTSLTVKYFIFF